jgi:Tfp pilus assembly protein PilN
MINLLPPQVKEQIWYSKKNAKLVKLVWLLIILAICIGLSFAAAHWQLSRTLSLALQGYESKQAKIDSYKATEAEAKALSGRLKSVKLLQTNQTKFSKLLDDLARFTPQGSYINSISLNEDSKKPVNISATSNSYNGAASLRDAFARSERVQAVDISNISNPAPGEYQVDLTVSFKPGLFK